MVNPVSTFRWFFDVAKRRPKLVSLIGLGMIAEAGRVWIGLDAGRPVTLLGHGGFETLDPIADAGSLVAYAFWVGFCGVLLLVLTRFARRSARAQTSVAAAIAPPSVAAAVARKTAITSARTSEAARAARPPVVRRMRQAPVMRRR